jgi:hypothetical protein
MLCKHRSTNGPATILNGVLIGTAIGIGSTLLPTLLVLIGSNHLEMAKTVIIVTYLSVTFFGAVFVTIARKYVDSIPTGGGEIPRDS